MQEQTGKMTITAKDTRIRGHVSLQKTIKDSKPGTVEGTEFALYKQAGTSPDISKDAL